MKMVEKSKILEYAKEVLEREAQALKVLENSLEGSFTEVVKVILDTLDNGGRVIVMGVGKSGIVGRKIAATMSSVGIPCYFVHADEALHGDLGMVTRKDVVFAISHSGKTEELLAAIRHVKQFGNHIIAITKSDDNPLAEMADITLCTYVENEADHMNVAPTASSTTTLALGDALAITIARIRGFDKSDFLKLHPGGALGNTLKEVVNNM